MTGETPPIATGAAHHAAGRLDEAAAIYRRILDHEPDHADALHLLGVARMQLGRPGEAIELISRAEMVARIASDLESVRLGVAPGVAIRGCVHHYDSGVARERYAA